MCILVDCEFYKTVRYTLLLSQVALQICLNNKINIGLSFLVIYAKIIVYLKRWTYPLHSLCRDMAGGICTCRFWGPREWYMFRRSCTDFHGKVVLQRTQITFTTLTRYNKPDIGVNATAGSGAPMTSAECEPITGVWGQSPRRGPGAEPLVRRSGGKAPWIWKLYDFWTSNWSDNFYVFRYILQLGTPNLGYTISRQGLTKFDIWQIFILQPSLKDTNALTRKYWKTHSRNLQLLIDILQLWFLPILADRLL